MKLNPISITYRQRRDSNCPDNIECDLTISVDDVGGGSFVVINTPRWAFDGPEEVDQLCRAIKVAFKWEFVPKDKADEA